MTVLGKRQVRLLTDSEVTESLKSGELNISMLSVDHLPDIASLSKIRLPGAGVFFSLACDVERADRSKIRLPALAHPFRRRVTDAGKGRREQNLVGPLQTKVVGSRILPPPTSYSETRCAQLSKTTALPVALPTARCIPVPVPTSTSYSMVNLFN